MHIIHLKKAQHAFTKLKSSIHEKRKKTSMPSTYNAFSPYHIESEIGASLGNRGLSPLSAVYVTVYFTLLCRLYTLDTRHVCSKFSRLNIFSIYPT